MIVRLKMGERHREAEAASSAAFHAKVGHREGDVRNVIVERVSEDVVGITPQTVLEPGEFLLYLDASETLQSGYDFGISSEKKRND